MNDIKKEPKGSFFLVLSLKGKNQRNFKKTKIAKRQKGPKKEKVHRNERAHFCGLSPF